MPARLVWENHRSVTVHKFARVLCSHQYDFKNSTCLSVLEDFTITMKRKRSFFTHKATSNFKNSQAVIGPHQAAWMQHTPTSHAKRAHQDLGSTSTFWSQVALWFDTGSSLWRDLYFFAPWVETGQPGVEPWMVQGEKCLVIWLGFFGKWSFYSRDVTSRFLAQMELPVINCQGWTLKFQ